MSAADEVLSKFSSDFNNRMKESGKQTNLTPSSKVNKAVSPKLQQAAGVRAKQAKAGASSGKKAASKKPAFVADKAKQTKELKDVHDNKSIIGGLLEGVSRVTDVAARPFYAVAEAARQIPANINDGEPIWSLGDDIVSGAASGLWGTKKTGWGDVMDEGRFNMQKENPNDFLSLLFSNVPGMGVEQTLRTGSMTEAQELKRDKDGYLDRDLVQKMYSDVDPLDRVTRRLSGGAIKGDKGVGQYLPGVADVALDPVAYAHLGKAGNAVKQLSEDGGRRLIGEAAHQYTKETFTKVAKKAVQDVDPNFFNRKGPAVRGAKGQFAPGPMIPDDIAASGFQDELSQWIDEGFQEIQAGGKKGTAVRGPEMANHISNRVAFKYREKILSGLEADFNKAREWVTNQKTPGKTDWDKFEGKSKFHKAYRDSLKETQAAWIKRHSKGDLIDYGKYTPAVKEAFHNKAYKAALKALDDDASQIYNAIAPTMSQLPAKAITIRVLGQDKVTLRRTSDFTDWVGKKAGSTEAGRALREAFSYNDKFPGYTSLIGQKVRSQGIAGYETFADEVVETAKQFTKREREIISDAIHNGTPLEPRLQAAVDDINNKYGQLWEEEITSGVRQEGKAVKAQNYGYIYLNGGSETARRNFLEIRNKEIASGGPVTHDFKKAVQMGLKPEKDPFKALLLRKMKHQRKLTESWFLSDLVGHYGYAAKDFKNLPAQVAMDLKPVNMNKVTQATKASLKEGEKFFLPSNIHEVFENYRNMARLDNTEATKNLLKIIDWTTRKFKTSATVYYPSYHIRNMIGDMYMGVLDGVKSTDYFKFGPDGAKTVKVGNMLMTREQVKGLFLENAASGSFMNAEVGVGTGMLRGPGKKIQAGVRNISDARENFARMVHFYRALDDEASALVQKGFTDEKKILEMATDAATARVNAYKFDYNAVTPFEQKVMKRVMPFYTYSRKAMPILAESILMNPKLFSLQSRLMERGSENAGLDSMRVPGWLREIGFIPLGDDGQAEPTIVRKDILPTTLFSQFANPGYESGQSAGGGVAKNLMSMMNPLIQYPIELKDGKTIFSGHKAPWWELAAMKWRPYGTAKQLQDISNGQKAVSMLTGIPIMKLTEGQQRAAFKSHEDFMQDSINRMNRPLRDLGYKIYYVKRIPEGGKDADGTFEYRVGRLTETGENIPWLTGFSTLEEATKALTEKSGVKP